MVCLYHRTQVAVNGLTSDLKVDLPPQPQTSLSNYKPEKEPTPGAGAFEVLGEVGD